MLISYGSKLPDTVKMYIQKTSKWGHIEHESRGTFPCNPLSKTQYQTAERWADTKEFDEVPNHFRKIEILGESSRQNHITYKILLDDTWVLDLRSDVLFDIMKNSKIEKSIVNDEFCFVVLVSEFKLVRVGSDLYNRILVEQKEKDEKDNMKAISLRDLVLGGVYLTKTQNGYYIYIGKKSRTINKKICNYNIRGGYAYETVSEKGHCFLYYALWNHQNSIKNFDVNATNSDNKLLSFLLNVIKQNTSSLQPNIIKSPKLYTKQHQLNIDVLEKFIEEVKLLRVGHDITEDEKQYFYLNDY